MRRAAVLGIAAALSLTAALADTGSAPPTAPAELARQQAALAAKPVSKFIWQMGDDGTALHLQSNLECPAKIGGFERGNPAAFDRRGLDVGCDYENPLGISVTIYLTQRPGRSLDADLAKAQSELSQFHPDDTLLPPTAEGALADDAAWKRVLYTAGKDTTRSGIWVRDLSGWTLEFRATYPAGASADAVAVMNTLTTKALATAGAHLSACAAASPVIRKAEENTDQTSVMSLVLVAGLPAADGDGKAVPVAAPNWCVEPVADDLGPALFWRNIASDEHNGPVDRLTVIGETKQQIIVIEGAPLLSIIENEETHKDLALDHVATLTQGTKVFILAIYHGRPTAAQVFDLAREVLTGKRQPLASHDGKNITITMPPSGK